jgi:hypothetical protein
MKTQNNITLGSVIHATLRPEDLLGAFLFALEDAGSSKASRFNAELIELGFGHSMCGVCGMGNREEWPEGFDDDTAQEIIADMMDALNDIAPDGYYFGAHPGDGSDFGFWECEEWSVSDIRYAGNLGTLEIESGEYFDVLETETKLVFGSACNAGFLESGYILRDDCESLDETLQELHADLETFYRDGAQYVSRIVCNERM